MNKYELNKILTVYEKSVLFPDVSGMEHLDMLLARSSIEENNHLLNSDQKKRLSAADKHLLENQEKFLTAIQQIADLEEWRQIHNIQVSHWWWYLDVLSFVWPNLEYGHIVITPATRI